MIHNLTIENFLVFEHLEIPKLNRVNLIAGKNNTGKTTLLDALLIANNYDGKNYLGYINYVLYKRGFWDKGSSRSYSHLRNRNLKKEYSNRIYCESELFFSSIRMDFSQEKVRVTKYHGSKKQEYELDPHWEPDDRTEHIVVPFNSGFDKIYDLWENIVLTPKEDDVIEVLQNTIEPDLVRFTVGRDSVKIRLKNVEKPLPLQTLGDGVQRILLVAISLASAQGKMLLIDEIELGLHYTVLEKLWEMIFKYAKKWNIQVFVTTHSQDAIRSFYYVASQEEYKDEAEFIRLQKSREGKIEAVIYDTERLENSLELKMDIR